MGWTIILLWLFVLLVVLRKTIWRDCITLIEFMIVVVIVALLATIAIPNFLRAKAIADSRWIEETKKLNENIR